MAYIHRPTEDDALQNIEQERRLIRSIRRDLPLHRVDMEVYEYSRKHPDAYLTKASRRRLGLVTRLLALWYLRYDR